MSNHVSVLEKGAKEGWTLQHMGNLLGLSRERVRQLMLDYNLKPMREERKKAKQQEEFVTFLYSKYRGLEKVINGLKRRGFLISFDGDGTGLSKIRVSGCKISYHIVGQAFPTTSVGKPKKYYRISWERADRFNITYFEREGKFFFLLPRHTSPRKTVYISEELAKKSSFENWPTPQELTEAAMFASNKKWYQNEYVLVTGKEECFFAKKNEDGTFTEVSDDGKLMSSVTRKPKKGHKEIPAQINKKGLLEINYNLLS